MNVSEVSDRINSIQFVLGSFAVFESEVDRRNFLKAASATKPLVRLFMGFSEEGLKGCLEELLALERILLDKDRFMSPTRYDYLLSLDC